MAKYKVVTDILQGLDKGDVLARDKFDHNEMVKLNKFGFSPTNITMCDIEEFPSMFEEIPEHDYKEGQWVKITDSYGRETIVKYTSGQRAIGFTFNLGAGGRGWTQKFYIENVRKWEKGIEAADPDMVEEYLIKEAKRRGLSEEYDGYIINPEGSKYRARAVKHGGPKYDNNTDTLWFPCGPVYRNGQWAEIVDEPIKINGHEVFLPEHNDDHSVQVGCEEIPIGTFCNFSKYGKKYGISFMRKDEDITEQIHEIADRLK